MIAPPHLVRNLLLSLPLVLGTVGCNRNAELKLELKALRAEEAELNVEFQNLMRDISANTRTSNALYKDISELKQAGLADEDKLKAASLRQTYLQTALEDAQKQAKQLTDEHAAYRAKFPN